MTAQTESDVTEVLGAFRRRNVFQQNWLLWKRRPLGLLGLLLCAFLGLAYAMFVDYPCFY